MATLKTPNTKSQNSARAELPTLTRKELFALRWCRAEDELASMRQELMSMEDDGEFPNGRADDGIRTLDSAEDDLKGNRPPVQ